MPVIVDLQSRIRSFQWLRGLRALVVMGSIMVVCHLLGVAPAAAALGGFDLLLIDNGGPYRTRLITMAALIVGGSIALILGCMVTPSLAIVLPVTALICFLAIYASVVSQPWASSSVLILVLYFAGLGGVSHTWPPAWFAVGMFWLGGLWSVVLSLMFWPIDPFRPARLAVADCWGSLATYTATLANPEPGAAQADLQRDSHDWRRQQRTLMETARAALFATAARVPSRTIRARNLTVLLETADLLLARIARVSELSGLSSSTSEAAAIQTRLRCLEQWLAAAEAAVRDALAHRPADTAASFAREGSQRLQFITRRRAELAQLPPSGPGSLLHYVASEERDAVFEIEVAFDAVRAIWTGADTKRDEAPELADRQTTGWGGLELNWIEAAQANWTISSALMRHALRMSIVGTVDVIVMRAIHINHGFWLPMTSLILLQPFSAGTARKSVQRVTGTVAGGFLAAILAAAIPGQLSMILVITALSALTVATYAVDYAIYSFFLTPAFVLLSLPHPHDWRYAGIRIGTTLAGATISLVAMRLLWPERAEVELGRLLHSGVKANADYLRAMLLFWNAPASMEPAERRHAERELLAPARRACGMASSDAEQAVDRVMQEPHLRSRPTGELDLRDEALTSVTYLRRLTQSITNLAAIGRNATGIRPALEAIAARLDAAASEHPAPAALTSLPANVNDGLIQKQMSRIERQARILERSVSSLSPQIEGSKPA